jgi:hypothetical protein
MRRADLDQTRSFGMFGDARFNRNRPHFVQGPAGGAHGNSFLGGAIIAFEAN